MTDELDKKLCEKYPKIFRDRYADMRTTCMCWGCECGDGWYNILDALCEALTYTYTTELELDDTDAIKYAEEYFTVEPPQVVADQVKEKFGTLRFYYHLEYDDKLIELKEGGKYPELEKIMVRFDSYIDGVVHFAEFLSGRICEETGKAGEMHVGGGWYKTLSREYAKTNEWCVSRHYAPVVDLKKEELA